MRMLTELTIENVAVIERAKLRFDGGFNVLTLRKRLSPHNKEKE